MGGGRRPAMPERVVARGPATLLAFAALSAGVVSADPGVLRSECPPEEEDAAASLVQMPLDRSRGDAGRERSERAGPFTALRPAPSLLQWGETPAAGNVSSGVLTVLMDPADHGSPALKLKVMMKFADVQPAPFGPLLIHCGGPGSGADCAIDFERYLYHFTAMGYDVWGISQRGIGGSEPSMKCSHAKLPATGKGHYDISDFSDCPCAHADGTPLVSDRLVNIDPANETQVRSLIQHMKKNGERCFNWDKMQFNGSNGKVYNFWEWSGTQMLANDIDTMRQAIGADKMNILGASYGTMVGAVYASTFPEYASRITLNGNVDPFVSKLGWANGAAAGMQQAFAKLLFDCENSEACPLSDPESEWYELLDELSSEEGMTALTANGDKFRLNSGLLIGTLAGILNSNHDDQWRFVLEVLALLSPRSGNQSQRTLAVEWVLNRACHVLGEPTWYVYGTCIGAGQIAEDDIDENGDTRAGSDSFIEMNAVFGQDAPGRWTLEDVVRGWRGVQQQYGSVGSTAYLAQMSALYSRPQVPTPVAPMGSPSVPVLVIGNLYDPPTSYRWSQEMHDAFPSGSMMTWQGVGHCLPKPFGGSPEQNEGAMACMDKMKGFFLSGELPQNGHTCRGFKSIYQAIEEA